MTPERVQSLLAVIPKLLPIFLIMGVGHLARRRRFLAPESVADLKRLIVLVTLPALLFTAFSSVRPDPRYLGLVATMFGVSALGLAVGLALRPMVAPGFAIFPALLTGFEAGMLGYALFSAVYGAGELHRFAILDLGQALLVYFVVVPMVQGRALRGRGVPGLLLGFFSSPVLLAMAAGLLVNLAGATPHLQANPLGAALYECLRILGGMTTALIALVVGYDIQLTRAQMARSLAPAAIRLAMWGVLALGVYLLVFDRLLRLDRGFGVALAMLAVLPPPFVYPLFVRSDQEHERRFAMDVIATSTLVALVGASVVACLWPGPL